MSERVDPRERDRLVGRMRIAGRVVAVAAAGATALLSVVAAHAFRGHGGGTARAAIAPVARVHVPPPQDVPAVEGSPPPPQPPAAPPEAAPPEPAPVTSGGS